MNKYQLSQVIVFSRHGIRTPLPNTLDFLQTVTSKQWPKWDCGAGYLTTRGGVQEAGFGHYFIQWLNQQGLSLTEDDIFVYANSLHRTVATAQYFTLGAFSGLDIPIHHKHPIEKMDSIFNPVIRNNSSQFKTKVIDDIRHFSGSTQLIEHLDLQLKPAYDLISDIIDYKQSSLYQQYQCELFQLPSQIELIKGEEPIVHGPLSLCTAIADAFTLQYYSAFTQENIAWGKVTNTSQWAMITNIKNQYLSLLFKTPILANHFAKPLIKFIVELLTKEKYKLLLLVGHDSNIVSLLAALGIDDYQLPGQYEQAPIGGKIVFSRFYDKQSHREYFKAEYVYQTFMQIHEADLLSLNNPARHVELSFSDLIPNQDGLYLWQDIEKKLYRFLGND